MSTTDTSQTTGIKTTSIAGDVAVGRNVSAGGTMYVAGSTTVGHNMTVKGWLEAANIKGAIKGIFSTLEELKSAYPVPETGWAAGVGTASPFTLYIVKEQNGLNTWVASGGTLDITVDMTEYTEQVEQLRQEVGVVSSDIIELEQGKQDVLTAGDKIDITDNTISVTGVYGQTEVDQKFAKTGSDIMTIASSLTDEINTVRKSVTAVDTALTEFEATKGKNGGIAPLDASGKVPTQNLPGYISQVVEFGGIKSVAGVRASTLEKSSTDDGCTVYFDGSYRKTFLIYYDGLYYTDWLDSERFGTAGDRGITPGNDKIFVDTSTDNTYRWSGSTLSLIGSGLSLGHTSSTAFPGDEGAVLQEQITNVYTKTEADAEIMEVKSYADSKVSSLSNTVYTKTDVDGFIKDAKAYADTGDEKLSDAIDEVSRKITNAYTKTEVDVMFGNVNSKITDTKTELNTSIKTLSDKVDDMATTLNFKIVVDPDCNPFV